MGRPNPNTNKPAIPGTTYGGRGNAANSTGTGLPYPPPEVHIAPQRYAAEALSPQHYATEPVAAHNYVTEPAETQHYVTESSSFTEPTESLTVQHHVTEPDEPQHYAIESDVMQHYDEPDEPQHYMTEPDEPQHYATESDVQQHYDNPDEQQHHETEPNEPQHYGSKPVEPHDYGTEPVESQSVPYPPAQPTPYPPPVQPVPYPSARPTISVPQYYNITPDETQPVPYPPAVPYPPPPASPLHPSIIGTPVQFPPPAQPTKNDLSAYAGTAMAEQWSSELSDCDMSQDYVIATAICPCVTFGQIAEIVDAGQTSCLLAGILYMVMIPAVFTCSVLSSGYRRKLREKYNLVEAPYDDCSVHLVNPCCALCQEYRELQMRGFDPSLGWTANLAQQQHDTSMAPPGNQFMRR